MHVAIAQNLVALTYPTGLKHYHKGLSLHRIVLSRFSRVAGLQAIGIDETFKRQSSPYLLAAYEPVFSVGDVSVLPLFFVFTLTKAATRLRYKEIRNRNGSVILQRNASCWSNSNGQRSCEEASSAS